MFNALALVCIYNGILLSHEKKEIGTFAEMRVDLDTVIQNEVSQKEESKYCILMHVCGI